MVRIFLTVFLLAWAGHTIGGPTGDPNYNKVTDQELQAFSENTLTKDVVDDGSIKLSLQNHVSSGSISPNPLLTYTTKTKPKTYNSLQKVFDAYNSGNNAKIKEATNSFIDDMLNTDVMKDTITFINSHGIPMNKGTMKEYLNQIWFTSYRRGGGDSSSGFQHVFMAELKDKNSGKEVSGLHNWLFFQQEEKSGNLKYHGYSRHSPFKGYTSSIVKIQFSWRDGFKPAGSMLVGTSPELEMALYTVCFTYRKDNDCNIKLANNNINIKTFTWFIRPTNQQVVATAFPVV